MKKSIYSILFCLVFSFACDENNDPATACGVSDPVENLPWLKQLAEDSANQGMAESSYIMQAKYKRQIVFFLGNCSPNAAWALIVRDCKGDVLSTEIRFEELEEIKVIWKPENSPCRFD